MKKIFLFAVVLLFAMTSCKKDNMKDVYTDFVDSVNNCESYELQGEMEIKRNNESDKFQMDVIYKAPNLFKVTYQNLESNSRQVLLKNSDGVYVLCPELNKEFKFESSWPLNSSHIYIINKVIEDLNTDTEREISQTDENYIFKSKINHHIKKDLNNQKVYLDKKTNELSKISYNNGDAEQIILSVNKFKLNQTCTSNEFSLDQIMKQETALIGEGETKKCSQISCDNPFNLEVVTNKDDKITIVSFKGEKNYTIVYQELSDFLLTTSRVYDEFVLLEDSLGFTSTSSLTFYKNNYEFKIVSSTLTLEEMVEVANSIQID